MKVNWCKDRYRFTCCTPRPLDLDTASGDEKDSAAILPKGYLPKEGSDVSPIT